MKNPYLNQAKDLLKSKYDLCLVEDIILSRENQIILFLDVNEETLILRTISGTLSFIGLDDVDAIHLDDLMKAFDLNNSYGEINGKQAYYNEVKNDLYDFNHTRDVSFPIQTTQGRKWIRCHITPIPKQPSINVFTIFDVTKLHTQEEETFAKSHLDSLTKIYNKYTFDFHYGLVYLEKNFHVIFMDVDHLKYINDTFGHSIGNEFLVAFANVLKSFQTETCKFYRLGGDEFAGLVTQNEDTVKQLAAQIIDKTRSIKINSMNHQLTISMGIVKAMKSEGVARKADELMYKVKNSGKNDFLYEIEKES